MRLTRPLLLLTPLLLACGPWFYSPPPPLTAYSSRIPGKSWNDILNEKSPLPPEAVEQRKKLVEDCRLLAIGFTDLATQDRIARVDAFLESNRSGLFSIPLANLLLEMRELAPNDALAASAKAYLTWRADEVSRLFLNPSYAYENQESPQAITRKNGSRLYRTQLDQRLEESTPELRPYYLVQQAAMTLTADDAPSEAADKFANIVKEFPDHPRAEVALFMLARCRFVQTALSGEGPGGANSAVAAAAFQDYLHHYPQGRFASDAHGWLGGLSVLAGQEGEAIGHQIDRLELSNSRETMSSVLRECDQIFDRLFTPADKDTETPISRADGLPWKRIAGHPELVRLFIVRALDPCALKDLSYPATGFTDEETRLDFLRNRLTVDRPFARHAMPLLADAVAARFADVSSSQESKKAYEPLSTLVLGWTALQGDEAEKALTLFDTGLAATRRDDLLQGRATALTALGRHGEASETYEAMAREFPASSIVASSDFERAMAHYRAGAAGWALLDLALPRQATGEELERPELHMGNEIPQWTDAIAQFAAIEQIAAPLESLPPDDPRAAFLRAVVRGRALAAERFDLAARYLEPRPVTLPPPLDDYLPEYMRRFPSGSPEDLPDGVLLDEERWNREIAPLAALAAEAAAHPGDTALQLKLGRCWEERRGRITLPSQPFLGDSGTSQNKLDQLRRINASVLGIPPEEVVEMLDSRDELQHALKCYLAAADSPDPEVAAPALAAANEALFHLAEFSPYRLDRAVELDHTALSARLVARLRKDFKGTPETDRAIAWIFRPLDESEAWMPGDYNPGNGAAALEYSIKAPFHAEIYENGAYDRLFDREDRQQVDDSATEHALGDLTAEQALPLDKAREKISAAFLILRGGDFEHGAQLDDLEAAVSLPGMTPELFRNYAAFRLGDEPSAPQTREWEIFQPILDYRRQVGVLERHYFQGDRYLDRIEGWKAYLSKNPDGPKTEAATFQLLRARIWSIRPAPQIRVIQFPRSPMLVGYKHLMFQPVPEDDLPPMEDRIREVTQIRDENAAYRDKLQKEAEIGGVPKAEISSYYEEAAHYGDMMLEEMQRQLAQPGGDPSVAELLTALKDFESRYPASRFLPDLHCMRASLLADSGRPAAGIDDLVALIADPKRPELHREASLRFAEIVQRLLDPGQRSAIGSAIRTNPEALTLVSNLVHGDTCLFRLRPLMPWLGGAPR